MKIRYFASLIIVAGLAGCAANPLIVTTAKPALSSSQKQTWQMMIGKWYGSQSTKDGGRRTELLEHSPKGVYRDTYVTCHKQGKCDTDVEVGYWGVSGPIYFTIFRGWVKDGRFIPSDVSDPYNYDAYRIIKLDDKTIKYRAYESGNLYEDKKVPDDFKLPPAD